MKSTERLAQRIIKSDKHGSEFIEEVVKGISMLPETEYSMVGLLDYSSQTAESLFFYKDGELLDKFQYLVKNTPCEFVLKKFPTPQLFSENLISSFPNDIYITELSLEHYFGTTLLDLNGKPHGIVSLFGSNKLCDEISKDINDFFIEITPRIESELNTITLLAETQSNSQEATKLSFFADAFHDMNNVITILDLRIKNLQHVNADDNTQFKSIIETIDKSIAKMKAISESAKLFVRNNISITNELNVDSFINGIDIANYLKNVDVEFHKDISSNCPTVNIDPSVFERVVVNLLINAIHAVYKSTEKKIFIKAYPQDSKLCLEISDTGHGIPLEKQGLIFEKGYTTKSKDGGTGLGLQYCSTALERYNSKLELIDSKSGLTTFRITIPGC